jgi:hypothetical protein
VLLLQAGRRRKVDKHGDLEHQVRACPDLLSELAVPPELLLARRQMGLWAYDR